MEQDIYDYLNNYGFDDMEIDEIVNENSDIKGAKLDNIKKNVEFLESKKLELDDIINGIVSNPYLLTISNERLNDINKIYQTELKINDGDIKKMFLDNSESYTVSKKKLEDMIDFLSDDLEYSEINNLFVNNSRLLSLNIEEFKNAVSL